MLVDVEVPICGAVIKNDRGVIVHGKNSWQVSHDMVKNLSAGNRVLCQHRIFLNLQPGEYTFEVTLASIENFWWQKRDQISHEEISPHFRHLCSLPDAGSFIVGLAIQNGVSVLTHHGIADLPGDMKSSVVLQVPSSDDFMTESLIG
ncbi:MAG TPA: Wzt carbohydrate-binding domain-containing protein [Fusibacter sp.]|nr:Wzt carbohydrate-binding domain-containing protein [Fusibacter sp.]